MRMRRLFLVLDISLLRQPGAEQREVVLQQLTTTVARIWAAYQPPGTSGGSGGRGGRHVSWGYALFDSACPEMLLKPKLRRIAQNLRLPAAFQEIMQTGCKGSDLASFIALVHAAAKTSVEGGSSSEAPAAALARSLQNALGSSYMKKLQELADNDSSSGGSGGSKADGLLVLLTPGLSSNAQAQDFVGADVRTGDVTERLLAAALPSSLWQRCSGGALRVCWVAADTVLPGSCDGGEHLLAVLPPLQTLAALPPMQPLAVLPPLQAHMRQHCAQASAAPLAELAGPCSQAQFAARLALPHASAAVEQQAAGEQKEDGEDCWPAAVGPEEDAMTNLQLLVACLEGPKEREADAARDRLRVQHRQLAKHRQPAIVSNAARRQPVAIGRKGEALLEKSRRLQARKGGASQPNSARATTDDDPAQSDDLAATRAAAAAAAGEREEADSGHVVPPEVAAAELKRRLEELLARATAAEPAPAPTALLQQIRSLVESCYSSMQRYLTRRGQQQQQQQQQAAGARGEATNGAVAAAPAAAAAAIAAAADEATSALAAAPVLVAPSALARAATGQASQGQLGAPSSASVLDEMCSLLLQQVPEALADLRQQHTRAEEPAAVRAISHRFLHELLLRLSICYYGAKPCSHLPVGQYAEVEVLMQCLVATRDPIPTGGQDVFTTCIKKAFGARFPADMRRLQGELWDEDLSLDFDSMMGEQRDRDADMEVSGETPDCSTGPGASGASNPSVQRARREPRVHPTAVTLPSNLGRAGSVQREASAREGTSGRPSAGTARASGSIMSGEHSGVHGAGSVHPAGARSGAAAAALTATSRGALVNLEHIKKRYNNTKLLDLQVRSKVPANLLQKSKLKHGTASSRLQTKPTAATTAGGAGSSRAAAAVAAANRGRAGAALAPAPRAMQRPPREQPRRQVPATPDARGKQLREAAVAAATGKNQQHWQQQQQQQASMLSGEHITSPDYVQLAAAGHLYPGTDAWAGAAIEAIPDTDMRPALPRAPALAAGAGAAGGGLMRSPSMRLNFHGAPAGTMYAQLAPGAILASQEQAGSASTSPSGAAAAAAGPQVPTWMVNAKKVAKGGARGANFMPAVASFGAMAAAGSLELLAQPSAAAPAAEIQRDEEAPEAMDFEQPAASIPASPEAEALPQPAAQQQAAGDIPTAEAEAGAEAGRPTQMAEQAAEAEEDPRGRSRSRTAAKQSAGAATAVPGASTATRGRSKSKAEAAKEIAAAAAEPATATATRVRTRNTAAAEATAEAPAAAITKGKRGRSKSQGAPAVEAEAGAQPESATGVRGRIRAKVAAAAEEAEGDAQPTATTKADAQARSRSRAPAAAEPAAEDDAMTAAQANAAPATAARQRSRSRGKPAAEAATPAGQQAGKQASAPSIRPATGGTAMAQTPGEGQKEQEGAAPASKRRATNQTPAAVPAQEQPEAATSAPRRSERLTPVAAQAAEGAAAVPAQEQPEAATSAPRRSGRLTPVAAQAQAAEKLAAEAHRCSSRLTPGEDGQALAGEQTSDPAQSKHIDCRMSGAVTAVGGTVAAVDKPAAASSRGTKRHAAELAVQAAQQQRKAAKAAAQAGQQQLAEATGGLAHIAAKLGCSKCKRSPNGCSACRPAVVAALEEAGQQGLLAGVRQHGKCRGTGCTQCWATLVAAVAEAAPSSNALMPAAEQAAPTVEEAAPVARSSPGPALKRRYTRHSAGVADLPAPAEEQRPQQEEQTGSEPEAEEAVAEADADMAEVPAGQDEAAEQPAASKSLSGRKRAARDSSAPAHARKSGTRRTAQQEEQHELGEAEEAAPPSTAARLTRSASQHEELEAAAEATPPVAAPSRGRSGGMSQAGSDAAPSTVRRGRSGGLSELMGLPEQASPPSKASVGRKRSRSRSNAKGGAAAAAAAEAALAVATAAAAHADAAEAAAAAGMQLAGLAAEDAAESSMGKAAPAGTAALPVSIEIAAAADTAMLAAAAAASAAQPVVQVPSGPVSVAADAVMGAMAAAGALAQELDGGEGREMDGQQQPAQMPLGIEDILAASVVPSTADAAAAAPGKTAPQAAAAVAGKRQLENDAGEGAEHEAGKRTRLSGSAFSTGKRLGFMQPSNGSARKRSPGSEATSTREKRAATTAALSAPSPPNSSLSPVPALLRQRAVESSGAAQPGSPYEGAYSFAAQEEAGDCAAAAAGAGAGPAAELAGERTGITDRAAATAAEVAADEAAGAAGDSAGVERDDIEMTDVAAGQIQALGSPDVSAASQPARYKRALAQMQQEVHQRPLQQLDEQQQGDSDDSCPDSAMHDSQLMPWSPGEVAGPAATSVAAAVGQRSQAPTPHAKQRRLSPGIGAAAAAQPPLKGAVTKRSGSGRTKVVLAQQAQQPSAGLRLPVAGDKLVVAVQSAQPGRLAFERVTVVEGTPLSEGPATLATVFFAWKLRAELTRAAIVIDVNVSSAAFVAPWQPLAQVDQWQWLQPWEEAQLQLLQLQADQQRLTDERGRLLGEQDQLVLRLEAAPNPTQRRVVGEQVTGLTLQAEELTGELLCAVRQEQQLLQDMASTQQMGAEQLALLHSRQQQLQQCVRELGGDQEHMPKRRRQQQQPQSLLEVPGPTSSTCSPAAAAAPPVAPGETQRHNAAARLPDLQDRRSSLASLVLPHSPGSLEKLQKLQQEQQGEQPEQPAAAPTPRARQLAFTLSPPAAMGPPAAVPGSATRTAGRPPLPLHPLALAAEVQQEMQSPARLGLCSGFAAQLLRSPAQARPAAGAPSPLRRLPSLSAVRAQLASPAPTVRQTQQQQPQQQQQPVPATQVQPAGSAGAAQHAAFLGATAQHAQQASVHSSSSLQQGLGEAAVHVLLDKVRREATDAFEAGGLGDPAQQGGCVLLYCTKTAGGAGLPMLVQALVLDTHELEATSPGKRVSHRCRAVVLAKGLQGGQMEPTGTLEAAELGLGHSGHQQKEAGVRKMRQWHTLGRVSQETLSEVVAAVAAQQA